MRQPVRIGRLALDGKTPRVAVVIDRPLPMEIAGGLAARGADLLEVRVDLFDGPLDRVLEYVDELRATAGLPLLGTVRETDSNRSNRREIFARLIPLVDAVDIEVDTPIRDEITQDAKGRTIVFSEHDFERMPDTERLDDLVRMVREGGADILKVAGTARRPDEVAALLSYCHRCPMPMVAIAMGAHGTVSRVLAPLFGSLFTYTFVADSVAPGQMALDDLVAELRRYYPGFGG